MSLSSAIYVGSVRHRRRTPAHVFTFPMFMVYLDLSEIDRVLTMSRWWGRSRLCPARFRREDYLQRDGLDLDSSVRRCVEQGIGRRPAGPIRMLTHLRYFGYVFNPVTFYYCHEPSGAVDAVVAEITNTPWGERHAYVLDARRALRRGPASAPLRWRFGKEFHVSPLLPMDLEYDWTLAPPSDSLLVHMNLRSTAGARTFDATLRLARREITPGLLRSILVRYPLLTARVIARIHIEALRLWLKGAQVHRHPARIAESVRIGRSNPPRDRAAHP